MAFPITALPTSTTFSLSVTSMAVNLPASIVSGDLLIALVEVRYDGTWAIPTGWIQFGTQIGGSSVGELTAFYKIADGTESGTTPTWIDSLLNTAIWQVLKVTDWDGSIAPEITTASGDYTTNPDPPLITPSWGIDDTLWLEIAGNAAITELTTGASVNYTSYQLDTASTGGSQVSIASAYYQNNALSEDAGEFPNTGSIRYWSTFAIAIKPSSASITPVSITENGNGTEIMALNNRLLTSDNSNGSETINELVMFSLLEIVSGTENINFGVSFSLTDIGSSIEFLTLVNNFLIAENGNGTEITSILSMFSLSDISNGTEVINALNNLYILDNSIASEIINTIITGIQKNLIDTGTGIEILSLLNNFNISDIIKGNDSISLFNKIQENDISTGIDYEKIKQYIYNDDSANSSDIIDILKSIKLFENGNINEQIIIENIITKILRKMKSAITYSTNRKPNISIDEDNKPKL